jgi:hypothetical protein
MAGAVCQTGGGETGIINWPTPPCTEIDSDLVEDRASKRSRPGDVYRCATPPCIPIRPSSSMINIPAAPKREQIISRPKESVGTASMAQLFFGECLDSRQHGT